MSILADLLYIFTLLPHYAYHRLGTNKYGEAAPEKLGHLPFSRTEESGTPCLWLHAVSVGETLAARTLICGFMTTHPDWELVISTTTATGREVAQKNFPEARVIYFPLDCSWLVRRTFSRVQPTLIILMELEIWPNFMAAATARKIPVVVANVRLTERSTRRFRKFRRLVRPMLERVTRWLCQSEEYATRLRQIGINEKQIELVGSVKYDNIPTEIDPSVRKNTRALLGANDNIAVWVVGSTHPGEDEIILQAYHELRISGHEALKLILVPRHPERAETIVKLARNAYSKDEVVFLSEVKAGNKSPAKIVVGDTVGDLAGLYAAADAVFIGGSLLNHGGQNMMEPCGLGRATLIGTSSHNFAEAMQVLRNCNGIREVADGAALAGALRELLGDSEAAQAMGARARAALLAKRGATARTLVAIERVLTMPDADK